ncbi:hypothetical protein HBA55_29790 [Pseudomaricurvus alkylphenolicus]|uniref:hypothetical protein n=1 Tax=Pseudomaricurvus alkylphenolicus TaxID=1306991 RepID=UPI00141FF54A|nr:hypothetical protein [Pseudomaricurvus alkylphenolicus]NIB43832.1 hypothetical protein [Pseudomaricurvus alkylphenolicus]
MSRLTQPPALTTIRGVDEMKPKKEPTPQINAKMLEDSEKELYFKWLAAIANRSGQLGRTVSKKEALMEMVEDYIKKYGN